MRYINSRFTYLLTYLLTYYIVLFTPLTSDQRQLNERLMLYLKTLMQPGSWNGNSFAAYSVCRRCGSQPHLALLFVDKFSRISIMDEEWQVIMVIAVAGQTRCAKDDDSWTRLCRSVPSRVSQK